MFIYLRYWCLNNREWSEKFFQKVKKRVSNVLKTNAEPTITRLHVKYDLYSMPQFLDSFLDIFECFSMYFLKNKTQGESGKTASAWQNWSHQEVVETNKKIYSENFSFALTYYWNILVSCFFIDKILVFMPMFVSLQISISWTALRFVTMKTSVITK